MSSIPNSFRNDSVSVIVLNHNGLEMLHECLASLAVTAYPSYDVVVVDNGSTDGSCAMIEEEFPHVSVVKLRENLGYAKGNNMGILHSHSKYVVLLNNDTIVTPEWLSELMSEAEKNEQRFYQPKILFAGTKRINSAGNFIHLFGFAFPNGIGELDVGQHNSKCEVSYASGACVLVSRKLIERIGLLDESDLFSFYEDVNWGWRGLMLGYKSVYVPSACIFHRWGGSWGRAMSPQKFFLLERSRLATLFRNYSNGTLLKMLPILLAIETSVLLYSFRRGFASEKIKAYADLFKTLAFLSMQKKELALTKRLSDKIVIASFSDGFSHPYLGKFSAPLDNLLHLLSKLVTVFVV